MAPIVLTLIAYLIGGYEAAGLVAMITVGIRVIDSMYPDKPRYHTPPPSEWKLTKNYGIYAKSMFPEACAGVSVTELYTLIRHPCTYAPPPPLCMYPRCNSTSRVDYCP